MASNRTLTAANTVIYLTVRGLFLTPVRLQGFATDDIFDTEQIEPTETMMGVDGRLSGGFVPREVTQNFMLQADSDSVRFFDDWYQAQQQARETFIADGTMYLPATKAKLTMTKGFMKGMSVTPAAKKVLQPRRFSITWEKVTHGDI